MERLNAIVMGAGTVDSADADMEARGNPRISPIATPPEPDRIAARPGCSAGIRSAKDLCAW
jgi:hypothetical protein